MEENKTIINFSGRNLKVIEVNHNIYLQELYCNENRLTNIDLSHNTELRYLTCDRRVEVIGANPNLEIIKY